MHPGAIPVEDIDAALPQTQCTRCGYAGCAPYAAAIAAGEADINRCPPGGEPTIVALAALTGRAVKPLDPGCGTHAPLQVARIDEPHCIGCTLCIAACPVDAIIGGAKRMHAVLASLCSGCELCVAPCPVDCIVMVPAEREWSREDARAARERHRARTARLLRKERVNDRNAPAKPVAAPASDAAARRAAVAAALERARARRNAARG